MTEDLNAVELATELTIAWLANPNTRATAGDVPDFLQAMHKAVQDLSNQSGAHEPSGEPTLSYVPAVTPRRSLASKEHIISLIDGKPYKTLRRHLSGHGLTPAQYRERYGLKPDYPMVSPNYSEARRAMAHKIGLGQKGRAARKTTTGSQGAQPATARKAKKASTAKAGGTTGSSQE